jgi:hypothetical protein
VLDGDVAGADVAGPDGDTAGVGAADDEAVGVGAADDEVVGVVEAAGWPDDPADGVVAEGAGVLVLPVPEITSPMDVPVLVLPQTTAESGFPIPASTPVTQAMAKTKTPMASPP